MSFEKLMEDIMNLVDEPTKEIEDKAKSIVVGEYILEFPDHMNAAEAYDYILDSLTINFVPDDVIIWEAHSDYSSSAILENMETLKRQITQAFTPKKEG